jgi:uncharacterized protein YndB with AHSA1/START domain
MATMRVTPDQDQIISEIQVEAPPERVFEALTDPKQVVQWWGQPGIYRCTEFQADWRPGGKWRSAGEGGQSDRFEIVGEVIEIDPPRLLAYTWTASWTGTAKTTVRWELEAVAQGTRVRIRHSGLASHPEVAQSYRGWPRILEWIRDYLETGETVQTRKAS